MPRNAAVVLCTPDSSPPARLVALLAAARAVGVSFDDAWPPALERALVGDREAGEWRHALAATRGDWEAAWRRAPTSPSVRAIAALAEDPDRQPLPADELPATCGQCDAPLRRRDRGRAAIYCSARCRRDASAARVASRAA